MIDLVSTAVGGPQAEIAHRYLLVLSDASRYVNSREFRVYATSGATLVFRREDTVAEPT